MDDQNQVIVVGASTAGLFTATLLANGGLPVLLLDEKERLGPPARTLIVTPRIESLLGCIPEQMVLNRAPNLQLFSPRRSVTIRLNQPDLIVEREKLVRMLVGQAKSAGVAFLLGHRCLSVASDSDDLVVKVQSAAGRERTLRTRVLIGAEGTFSKVAGAVERDGHATLSLLQATVPLPTQARADTTQVWFDPQTTAYFYWLIPESEGRAVVGLIADAPQMAQDALDSFLDAQGLEPLAYQGAQVPLYAPNSVTGRRIDGAQVVLVGDAAGHVKMTTVGGVVTGLRGAQEAAEAILHGGNHRRRSAGLRRDLDIHLLVRKALNALSAEDYDDLLSLVNQRMRRVLAARTRDEAAPILLLSLLAQPRLLLLAAQSLVRSNRV
jgi:flavin-dependent dehydrogenase